MSGTDEVGVGPGDNVRVGPGVSTTPTWRHSVLHDPRRPAAEEHDGDERTCGRTTDAVSVGRCQRALGEVGRGDVLGASPEELLEISHGVLPMRLRELGAPVRSRASPAAFWLLTVPTETPSTSAVSRSVRSSKWRSTSTARCPGVRRAE